MIKRALSFLISALFILALIPAAVFMGGAEAALGSGIVYNPNIPSEEVFITPMRGEAEGIAESDWEMDTVPIVCEDEPVGPTFHPRKQCSLPRIVEDVLEKGDPYYSPNLTLDRGDCSPRRVEERFLIVEEIEEN